MSTAMTIYQEFDNLQRAAIALQQSGYFPDAKSEAQAIVKVMAGAELGLPPFASMTGIHIISGKPVLGANLIATLIKQHPAYDYRVTRLDDTECVLAFYERGEHVGNSAFSMKDAQAAGLVQPNWKRYPRNMLFARAISNGARWYCPAVFGGAAVYTPDELGVRTDEEGNAIIEGEVVQPAPPRPAPVNDKPSAPDTWDDIAPATPTNGNGKQQAHAPTTTSAADYRAWLETQPGPTIPMSLIAQGAVRLGMHDNADGVYETLRDNPKIKEHGIIVSAETRIKPASAVMLWDWLEREAVGPEWGELADLDATTDGIGPAAQ